MSHSSGIGAATDLKEFFGSANVSGSHRAIKVMIKDELLVKDSDFEGGEKAEEDFQQALEMLQEKEPCYLCYRLDTRPTGESFEWMLLAFVPDGSKVRDRMLYASTRFNLKKELGLHYFANDVYGTNKEEDFTWDALMDAKVKKSLDYSTDLSVMTEHERQLQEEDLNIAKEERGASTKGESAHALSFPILDDVKEATEKLKAGEIQLMALSVNVTEESVTLVDSKECTIDSLKDSIDMEQPRFYFFKYPHEYEEEQFDTLVFIYFCPDSAPIKERMILSTIKSYVETQLKELGLEVSKKIECRDEEDLEKESLMKEIHPPKPEAVTKRAFRKPAAPGKGGRRLVRKR